MKVLIIYSSLTGNTKLVCEKLFEKLNCEKKIIKIEKKDEIDFDDYDKIVVGTWINRGTADEKAKKLFKELKNKNLYYVATLGADIHSEHAEKCRKNLKNLITTNNNFCGGVLLRGKIAKELNERMKKFPLNIIHKFVKNMDQIFLESQSHPNEEDFKLLEEFSDNF